MFLSADEQERANRFRFISDRIRFTVAHAALREILAGYLAVDPTQVQYTQNAFGKPALAGHARLRFNMAHAAAYALVAVANGREVGVDVEGHRPGLDYEALARRVLSTRELEVLQSLQTIVRPAAFLRCWAQKEAFLKAVGTGLSARLDSIEVNPAPDAPAALLAIPPALGEVGRWCLLDLSMIDGYVAALAVEGRGITIRTRECPPPRGAATA